MVVFPNAKINIGLYVTEKRADGFHNLETVFYPVELCDILEINEADGKKGTCSFRSTGLDTMCADDDNLVVRAYRMLASDYRLPAVKIHLHKVIPFGAGLGGGSADAAFMLKALDSCFDLNMAEGKMLEYASRLGSDCAFFIKNKPMLASGRGDILEEIGLTLGDYKIALVKPDFGVSTPEAYAGIVPEAAAFDLKKLATYPVGEWKNLIRNDFGKKIFLKYPLLEEIKQQLYNAGAQYASMTGSGSAIFGIFKKEAEPVFNCPGCFIWIEDK